MGDLQNIQKEISCSNKKINFKGCKRKKRQSPTDEVEVFVSNELMHPKSQLFHAQNLSK